MMIRAMRLLWLVALLAIFHVNSVHSGPSGGETGGKSQVQPHTAHHDKLDTGDQTTSRGLHSQLISNSSQETARHLSPQTPQTGFLSFFPTIDEYRREAPKGMDSSNDPTEETSKKCAAHIVSNPNDANFTFPYGSSAYWTQLANNMQIQNAKIFAGIIDFKEDSGRINAKIRINSEHVNNSKHKERTLDNESSTTILETITNKLDNLVYESANMVNMLIHALHEQKYNFKVPLDNDNQSPELVMKNNKVYLEFGLMLDLSNHGQQTKDSKAAPIKAIAIQQLIKKKLVEVGFHLAEFSH